MVAGVFVRIHSPPPHPPPKKIPKQGVGGSPFVWKSPGNNCRNKKREVGSREKPVKRVLLSRLPLKAAWAQYSHDLLRGHLEHSSESACQVISIHQSWVFIYSKSRFSLVEGCPCKCQMPGIHGLPRCRTDKSPGPWGQHLSSELKGEDVITHRHSPRALHMD